MATRQDSAAVARRLRLLCLRVPGTADGRPYLNAALHAAATACPAPPRLLLAAFTQRHQTA